MYQVILVNLKADARSVSAHSRIPLAGVTDAALRELLQNFCTIDPIENSSADTEIRVVVRHQNFLLRTEQGKLLLYDVRQRDLPGQVLPLEKIMEELDGRAATARNQAVRETRVQAEEEAAHQTQKIKGPDRRKLAFLVAVAVFLAAANYRVWPRSVARVPADFMPPSATELATLRENLTGVYLTGSGPGQHGIVATGPKELKLFELAAVDAPRVVYASFTPGWSGVKLFLATDQPGGMVEVRKDGTLFYCGETYRRIP